MATRAKALKDRMTPRVPCPPDVMASSHRLVAAACPRDRRGALADAVHAPLLQRGLVQPPLAGLEPARRDRPRRSADLLPAHRPAGRLLPTVRVLRRDAQ